MELFDEEDTINPFFLMNLGLKEPYLVSWWRLFFDLMLKAE